MLLEFSVKNYKFFKDKMTFSMLAAPKQKGLDYSVVAKKIGSKTYKVLSSAIIYGPNASGKTNIIGAIDVLKKIILRGNIKNSEVGRSHNVAADALELIPNNTAEKVEPVEFTIKLLAQDLVICFSLSIDLGLFLDEKYRRKIIKEVLYVNEKLVYERNDDLSFGDFKAIKDYINEAFFANKNSALSLAKGSLRDEELFLTNGFKSIISSKLVNLIIEWIEYKLTVVYRADTVHSYKRFGAQEKDSLFVNNLLNKAAETFGINSNALGYAYDSSSKKTVLCSLLKNGKNADVAIPADVFESYGTIRFINLFPILVDALVSGGVLVIDEFDASIHPMALINIINIFHNNDVNINQAQLIVNSHNPIFLNSNIYRRDEINFIDRDDVTHCSTHYTLADFGTTGQFGVRNNEDYLKNYFINRYGGIKDIDFTPVFETIIRNNQKKEEAHAQEDK